MGELHSRFESHSMSFSENCLHEWNIKNIGFWTHTSPIQGPDFEIGEVENVKFTYSLEVTDNNIVSFVFRGTATPLSPCWLPLRVSVSVLTPERDEVCATSKDVDPFSETSTTLLELFSLDDGDESKRLDQEDLTLLIRTAERPLSIPAQVTREDRIPSSRQVRYADVSKTEDTSPPTLVHRYANGKAVPSFFYSFYRLTRPPPVEYVQCRYYSNKLSSTILLRIRPSLDDWRGKVLKKGKPGSFLFREDLESLYLPESIPASMLGEDSLIKQEAEYACITPENSYWRGSTSHTHCHRHHAVLMDDSATPDDRDVLMKRDRWTDLTILTDDGQSFPVHRCVLVARSRYFEAMLTTNMAEKDKEEIVLKDVDSGVLGHLLDFLYCGTLPEGMSVETAVELYTLANYLEVLELCSFCLHHIMKQLRLSNILSVLPIAHCDPDLDREVKKLFTSNAEELFQSAIWKEWEEKCPEFCEKFANLDREDMGRADTGYSASDSCDNNRPVIDANQAYDAITAAVRNMLL